MDDLILRPVEESDLDALCRYVTDPKTSGEFEWIGFKDPKALQRRWEEDGWLGAEHGRLTVERSGSFVGDVSYKDRSQEGFRGAVYEIGIGLLPGHRGRGLGTRAQQLLVEYLFANTPAHRIEAWTEVENVAERRALEKAGFASEGILRARHFRAGAWRDSVVYALLRDRP